MSMIGKISLPMPLSLTKEQRAKVVDSLQRFADGHLDQEMSDLQAGAFLDYILKEIAPFAYNQGVEDAQKSLLRFSEDLSGSCFEEPMTYWDERGATRVVRRKP